MLQLYKYESKSVEMTLTIGGCLKDIVICLANVTTREIALRSTVKRFAHLQ